MSQPAIGIFALQGDVELHTAILRGLGIEPAFVRMPHELNGLDGIIIPGGESTTYLKLTQPIGLDKAIREFASKGKGVFGTCAGTIFLAREVTNPYQESLNLIDIAVERNSYGRQLDSSDAIGEAFEPLGNGPLHMTFIRAPRIVRVGEGVRVLAKYKDDPVLVQQNNVLTGTFHPELSNGVDIYKYWFTTFMPNS
jgi:5'-phosphate synthase pdxT subunit